MTGWWLSHPSEKYEFVNGKDDIPYMMDNKTCLKPPTRLIMTNSDEELLITNDEITSL